MKSVTGCPIKFVGVSEKLDGLEPFYPERAAGRILDMGDVVSLVEKAAETIAEEDAAHMMKRMSQGSFDMNDMHDMAKHIRDIIYSVKGIKKIDLFGVQDERIYLKFESTKLAELGINPSQISAALKSQNIILPGGQVDTGARSFVLEPTGDFKDIEAVS